ncbi:hypothetical protein CXB51_030575 [Gossypium anomalum]|uniref:Succinate dehydrogenase assembly factor 4, mitochondrial n=1 Tax=Gossypium anomalum TaxID=47600 RepID=A0A8J6CQZ2_9ROSI|nr:hypothetical protein CXB51_030575 [Gossypium anomalum]
MAKTSLSRLFTSLSEHSIAKLSFTSSRSESVNRSGYNSVTRFVCFSAQETQLIREERSNEGDREAAKENLESVNKEEDEGEDGDHVNKETGEVGGPKGPEPTRYGDWERNGRCSDF